MSFHPGPPFQPEHDGFWSLVLYEDLARVHRDWRHFSSEGADGPGSEIGGDTIRDMDRADGSASMMILTDPPRQTAYRKLVNRGFTPKSVAELEPRLRAVTRARRRQPSRRAASATSCRSSRRWCRCRRSASCSGVPEDGARAAHRVDERDASPYGETPDAAQPNLLAAKDALFEYALELVRAEAARPGRRHRESLGGRLDDVEFQMFMLLLVFRRQRDDAFGDLGGMLAFSQYPSRWARLRRPEPRPERGGGDPARSCRRSRTCAAPSPRRSSCTGACWTKATRS
jgi:cytochrome P450